MCIAVISSCFRGYDACVTLVVVLRSDGGWRRRRSHPAHGLGDELRRRAGWRAGRIPTHYRVAEQRTSASRMSIVTALLDRLAGLGRSSTRGRGDTFRLLQALLHRALHSPYSLMNAGWYLIGGSPLRARRRSAASPARVGNSESGTDQQHGQNL
jgi:hypothetical protein